MAQGTITAAQTPLLVSDVVSMLKADNNALALGTVDFLTPYKLALPQYAAGYTGNYYTVASQTSAPQTMPAAQYSGANGKTYEIAIPSTADAAGITQFVVTFGSSGEVSPTDMTVGDHSTWDMTTANTAMVYWTQRGRNVRTYIPIAYSSSSPLGYTFGYSREPTYPQVVEDAIDIPADDFSTFYSILQGYIKIY